LYIFFLSSHLDHAQIRKDCIKLKKKYTEFFEDLGVLVEESTRLLVCLIIWRSWGRGVLNLGRRKKAKPPPEMEKIVVYVLRREICCVNWLEVGNNSKVGVLVMKANII
ncbi:hypothetical protein MKW94_027929, partial [Papaver nudicaule]|nr:hypothetical protein [Papaver nudicaule]